MNRLQLLPGGNPLKDAHAALDAAVLAAYGFTAKADVLNLNQQVAARIKKADPVPALDVTKDYAIARDLVTEDSIRSQLAK